MGTGGHLSWSFFSSVKHLCALQSTKGAAAVSRSVGLVFHTVASLPRATPSLTQEAEATTGS